MLAFPKSHNNSIDNNPSFQVSSFPAFSNLEPKGPYHGCLPTLVVDAAFNIQHHNLQIHTCWQGFARAAAHFVPAAQCSHRTTVCPPFDHLVQHQVSYLSCHRHHHHHYHRTCCHNTLNHHTCANLPHFTQISRAHAFSGPAVIRAVQVQSSSHPSHSPNVCIAFFCM